MESQTDHSRRCLGHFLSILLDKGTTPGLHWIDRDKRIFGLHWTDNRSVPGRDNEENIIFKEWEIYKNRHTEGENLTALKHTFSQAVKTSKSVFHVLQSETETLHVKKTSAPYRIYRLDYALNLEEPGSSEQKNKSMMIPVLSNSNVEQHEQGFSNSTFKNIVSTETRDNYYNGGGPNTNNIPTVVTDVELDYDDSFNPQSEIEIAADFTPVRDANRNSQMNTFGVQLQPEAMDVDVMFNNIPVDHHPRTIVDTDRTMEAHYQSDNDFRLESDEFNCIFQRDATIDLVSESLPSFSTPDGSLETVNKPLVKFQAYYFNKPVLEGAINHTTKGVRLFSGLKLKPEVDYPPMIFGPKEFEQVELPQATTCSSINKVKRNGMMIECIGRVLGKMNRGLLLFCGDGKLFALRLCETRVFVWRNKTEGSFVLDRKSKIVQQLFDMNSFKTQLDLFKSDPANHTCPSPSVILTFGQMLEPDDTISKELVFHVELTYREAEDLLLREHPPHGQDLQFSGFDSGDKLAHHFTTHCNC